MIAVVTHSGFLRVGISQNYYENADYRLFDFKDDGSNDLEEWSQTRERGGGLGRSPKGSVFILPTDFPNERLSGNSPAHEGEDGRGVTIEMPK